MPQRQVITSPLTTQTYTFTHTSDAGGTGAVGSTDRFRARVSNLLNSIRGGSTTGSIIGHPVRAADILSLRELCHALITAHQHSITEMTGQDTFGNLTQYTATGTFITSLSTVPLTPPAVPAITSTAGSAITAADINVIVSAINYLRSHNHQGNDVTS